MPILEIPNREQLDAPARDALESVLANLIGYLYTEHDDEGAHGDITADSLTLRAGGAITLPDGTTLSLVDGVPTLTDALTIGGVVTSEGAVNSGGQVYSNIDTYAISGTTNLTFQGGWLGRVTTSTASPKLGGIVGGVDGQFFALVNTTATTFDILHDSSGTFSVSQILCPREIDLPVGPACAVLLCYDGTSDRWRVVAVSTRDGLYQDYTPTMTSSGADFAANGGTLTGRYEQTGKAVQGRFAFIGDGAGPDATNWGTGSYTITLPVASAALGNSVRICGTALIYDASAGAYYTALLRQVTTTTVELVLPTAGLVSATNPITFAGTDQIGGSFAYEAA